VLVLAGLPLVTGVTWTVEAVALGAAGAAVAASAGVDLAWRAEIASLAHATKSALRRRRFKRAWRRIMHDARLVKSAKVTGMERHPRLRRVRMATPDHLIAVASTAIIATPPEALQAVQGNICAAAAAKVVKVNPINRHQAQIHIFWRDPLERTIRTRDLPPARRPIAPVVGFDDDGEPLATDLTTPLLIAAEQGAGKSCGAWGVLDGVRRSGLPLRLRVIDPKGGQEFGQLDGAAHEYEWNPNEFPKMVERAMGALRSRREALRKRGIRFLTRFTPDCPLDVLLIDELYEIALRMKRPEPRWRQASENFQFLLSQGRSAGFTVLGLTQNPKISVIGEGRDLFPNRIVMRVNSDSVVPVMLNVDQAANKYPAHLIRRPGEGFYAAAGQPIRRFRFAHVTDGETHNVVRWLRTQRRPA